MNATTATIPTKKRKNTNDRITVDALKFYIPSFHAGDGATTRLLYDKNLSAGERNSLETRARLMKLSTDKIAALSGPLITRELTKIIKTSHLYGRDDLFDIIYYAGINGLMKGLRRFDVDKINVSSTNYIFQWIVTYAKKELNVVEAPFGIAPSRFNKYKKISAVRKKMTEENNGVYATNEEVLKFFHSGKADVKNMNGRVEKKSGPYASNQGIKLDIIEEQENFEKNLNNTALLDPLADYSAEIRLSEKDKDPFMESVFGVFLYSYNFTVAAKAVLMSDLGTTQIPADLELVVMDMPPAEYKRTSALLKELLKDKDGPFHEFLVNHLGEFTDFDIKDTLNQMDKYEKKIDSEKYLSLFVEKRIEKHV